MYKVKRPNDQRVWPGKQDRMPRWKKDKARQMRSNQTESEKVLWEELRKKRLGHRFMRQRCLYGYIADFYCASAKLVVEVDGSSHDSEERRAKDRFRDKVMLEHGLTTIRISAYDVMYDIESVLSTIRIALRHVHSLDKSNARAT